MALSAGTRLGPYEILGRKLEWMHAPKDAGRECWEPGESPGLLR